MWVQHRHRHAPRSLMESYSARMGALIDHRRAVSALRAAKEEAESLSRAKSDFITNMSHELRTPLNAVIGFAGILRDDVGGLAEMKRSEYAGDILAAGEHLLTLINDILDFSKLTSGKLGVDEEPVDIVDEVDTCCEMMRAQADKKSIALMLRSAAGVCDITTDPLRVRQVILNIVSNAVKFTPEGGRIDVICAPIAPRGVAVQIRDTGVGMTEEEVAVALTPFGQVQNVLSRTAGGSGVGLPLVKALCELLNASFKIQSKPGTGTTVTIVFRDVEPAAA